MHGNGPPTPAPTHHGRAERTSSIPPATSQAGRHFPHALIFYFWNGGLPTHIFQRHKLAPSSPGLFHGRAFLREGGYSRGTPVTEHETTGDYRGPHPVVEVPQRQNLRGRHWSGVARLRELVTVI